MQIEVNSNFLVGMSAIVGKDDLRPVLQNVFLDKGKAVATDAHHMVVIDLELWGFTDAAKDLVNGYYVDIDVLKELSTVKKGYSIKVGKGSISVYKDGKEQAIKTLHLQEAASSGTKYPNYEGVMPTTAESINRFSIDAKYLVNIQKIYKSIFNSITDGSYIQCYGHNRPIVVKTENSKFYGLIMPKVV